MKEREGGRKENKRRRRGRRAAMGRLETRFENAVEIVNLVRGGG